jgi:hypothetical protein
MRWSAAVKRLQPFLAHPVRTHIGFHAARYRHAHDDEGRAWITWDGLQIASFETIPNLIRVYGLAEELKAIGSDVGAAWDQAIATADAESNFAMWDFTAAVEAYPSTSPSEALASTNPLIRGLAMLDRRVGKRRLGELEIAPDSHPFVRSMLELRLTAERVASTGAVMQTQRNEAKRS